MDYEPPKSEPGILNQAQRALMEQFLHDFSLDLDHLELIEVAALDQSIADLREELQELNVSEIRTPEDFFKIMAGFILGIKMLSTLQEEMKQDSAGLVGALLLAFAQLAPDELKHRS